MYETEKLFASSSCRFKPEDKVPGSPSYDAEWKSDQAEAS
jgi:hypothetical protein